MQEFMEGKVFGGVKTSSPIAKIVTFRPLKRWPREALVDGVGWVGGDGDGGATGNGDGGDGDGEGNHSHSPSLYVLPVSS